MFHIAFHSNAKLLVLVDDGKEFGGYLVFATFWRITVELINDNGVGHIFHPHVLEPYTLNITRASLKQKTPERKGTNRSKI